MESKIELDILVYLNQLKIGFFWKNTTGGFFDGKSFRKQANPFAINGVADIIGIVKGRFVFFEVKTKTGRPSEAQSAWIRKASEHGAVGAVVRSIEEVRKVLLAAELLI